MTRLQFVAILILGLPIVAPAASTGGDSSAASPVSSPVRVPGMRVNDSNPFDQTYQFIFFATLEGLYRDGVSGADVDALLATKGKDGGYLNFIYTCPICMPVAAAIVTYKGRPRIDH